MRLALALLACFISLPARAEPSPPKAAQKENLQQIQDEVHRLEGGIKNGRETEASLSSELGRLEKLLKLQALEIQLSSLELEKLEAHVQEMNLRKDSLESSIEERRHRLRMALSLLPTLETRSPVAQLTESDGSTLSQYREMLHRMLQTDKQEILSLHSVLDEVDGLNEKLADDKERLLAHNEDLKEKQAVLELNQKLKKDLLHKTRAEQTDRLRAYQSAKAAEVELESVLSRFNLAAEVQRQKEEAAEIHPLRHAGSSFASHKGALPMPAEGRIVTIFGRRYDAKTSLYTFHKGVDIQSEAGANVKAIFPGKVVYSGRIGGYGQLLILDHGDQYYSLVGQLGEPLKKEGDEVRQDEVIGRSALDGTPVYFEIRQRHVAVNPLPWFSANEARQPSAQPAGN